jgi:hypothetical protein
VIPALDVPIYFIGHSLGGLVIQQALLHCLENDDSLHQVAEKTAGIIFMGTPTKGSGLASWASTLRKAFQFLVPFWANNINREILNVLEKKSDVCKRVQSEFESEGRHGKLVHLKLFCFYETTAMSGTIVVPKKSAVIKTGNSAPISATHRDIVKFASKNDFGYTKVVGQFKVWTKGMVRADKPRAQNKVDSDDPDKPDYRPGDDDDDNDNARRKKNAVIAYGNRFESISGISGGNVTFGNTVVGGDQFDMRNMGTVSGRGKIIGKVVYERSATEDQWSSSDQWDSSDDEPDEED